MRFRKLFLLLCLCGFAEEAWFTGPIVASSGNVIKRGHINFEPYVVAEVHPSFYNNDWELEEVETLTNVKFRPYFWVGLTEWMDWKIVPGWNWSYRASAAQWTLADFTTGVDIKLLYQKGWQPDVKLSVLETFPTGKYKNLNRFKLGTDSGGNGVYRTSVILNSSYLFNLGGVHFLRLFCDLDYSFATNTHVTGFNAYGGGFGTDGEIDPGQYFAFCTSFEYALSRNWVLACDFTGQWASKIIFSGTPGIAPDADLDVDPEGLPATNQAMASVQYTLAPAIEYNWSANVGLLAGCWLTVAGKNVSRFITGVVAVNYYH